MSTAQKNLLTSLWSTQTPQDAILFSHGPDEPLDSQAPTSAQFAVVAPRRSVLHRLSGQSQARPPGPPLPSLIFTKHKPTQPLPPRKQPNLRRSRSGTRNPGCCRLIRLRAASPSPGTRSRRVDHSSASIRAPGLDLLHPAGRSRLHRQPPCPTSSRPRTSRRLASSTALSKICLLKPRRALRALSPDSLRVFTSSHDNRLHAEAHRLNCN